MMRQGKNPNHFAQHGNLRVSVHTPWNYDGYEVNIWETLPGSRGSAHYEFGAEGVIEKVFVKENEEPARPSLFVSAMLAPPFFRIMAMAADDLGVLPDAVATQIAKLEAENALLREMLERADRAALEHRGDLRTLADLAMRRIG